MTIAIDILYIVFSIMLVLWGASKLTDGAVGVAARMGMPQIVIGLTIVAMGTSMPEFCVSLVSAVKGTPDMAVGNIVGSNIFNAMLIVGCAALVAPMTILPSTVRKDIPFALVASAVLLMMCLDGTISRLDAAVLFVLFLIFMYVTLRGSKMSAPDSGQEADEPMKPVKAVLFILLGLLGLIVGSNVFVSHASSLAGAMGVSEAVVGLTVVAGGTSLPELATSIVSARKGNSGIAIGNVLGSNVFNILFILGGTGLITPMTIQGITTVDLSMMMISMILLWLFSYTKYTIQRWEGALLVALYAGYMGWLIANA